MCLKKHKVLAESQNQAATVMTGRSVRAGDGLVVKLRLMGDSKVICASKSNLEMGPTSIPLSATSLSISVQLLLDSFGALIR